jgi:hypothetical protein
MNGELFPGVIETDENDCEYEAPQTGKKVFGIPYVKSVLK